VIEQALEQARSAGRRPLVMQLEMRLKSYRRGKPFRQQAG
jgi:hypothetical protein